MLSQSRKTGAIVSAIVIASFLVAFAYETPAQPQAPRPMTSGAQLGRKELPAEEYKKLRAQVLAGAKLHLLPRTKNPNVNDKGLTPAVAAVLKEQQDYLRKRGPLVAGELQKAGRGNAPAPSQGLQSAPLLGIAASGTCSSAGVRLVNGRHEGVVFTPEPNSNSYRIEGCAFGTARGQVQLEPRPLRSDQSALPITLQVESSPSAWSDHEIDAHLDPHLTGIPDTPVMLVIYPGKGQRIELPGCFFLAVRGTPQLLASIPSSFVHLQPSTAGVRSIQQLEYVSPAARPNSLPATVASPSALVVRSDTENFGPGSDRYEFSGLSPGWVVESVQLQTFSVTCPADVTRVQATGRWETGWSANGFSVGWQDDVCSSNVPPAFTFNLSFSEYAVQVWVMGPAGTQPLTSGLLRPR